MSDGAPNSSLKLTHLKNRIGPKNYQTKIHMSQYLKLHRQIGILKNLVLWIAWTRNETKPIPPPLNRQTSSGYIRCLPCRSYLNCGCKMKVNTSANVKLNRDAKTCRRWISSEKSNEQHRFDLTGLASPHRFKTLRHEPTRDKSRMGFI